MKHTQRLVALSTLLIAGACSAADAFVRLLLLQGSSFAKGFDGQTGLGAEIGAYVDAPRHHELGFGLEYYDCSASANALGLISSRTDASLMRGLFNYRYRFGRPEDSVRLFTGPAAGFTSIRVDSRTSFSTPSAQVHITAKGTLCVASLGWTAGATLKLSEHVSLVGGYRALWTGSGSKTLGDASMNVNSRLTHHFFAGAEYRF